MPITSAATSMSRIAIHERPRWPRTRFFATSVKTASTPSRKRYFCTGVSTFQPGFTPFTFTNNVDRFDPLVNLAFDASQDIHLYAKYATGFRAGGADDRSQKFDSFGPESVKSYEIGAKMEFFDHKVRLNLAGYLMDRKNTQFDFDLYDTDANSPTFNSHLEEAINAQGTTVLLVEQNAQQALSRSDRAYILETGRVTRSGVARELLKDDSIRAAYLGVA